MNWPEYIQSEFLNIFNTNFSQLYTALRIINWYHVSAIKDTLTPPQTSQHYGIERQGHPQFLTIFKVQYQGCLV